MHLMVDAAEENAGDAQIMAGVDEQQRDVAAAPHHARDHEHAGDPADELRHRERAFGGDAGDDLADEQTIISTASTLNSRAM